MKSYCAESFRWRYPVMPCLGNMKNELDIFQGVEKRFPLKTASLHVLNMEGNLLDEREQQITVYVSQFTDVQTDTETFCSGTGKSRSHRFTHSRSKSDSQMFGGKKCLDKYGAKSLPYHSNLNTDDLEMDTILAMERNTKSLPKPPKVVPRDYCEITDGPPVRRCFFSFSRCPKVQKPDEEKEILIPHKYADRPEGDTFGARIWTYKNTLKDGKCYYQHFFKEVEPDQPAAKMKIRDNDELVLLNDVFVPELKQVDVLNLFHKVKVDGKTRLTLVIRRVLGDASRRKENKWEWIETSAILAPDVHSTDHVEVEKPLFRELTDGELEPTERLYKVPGTQLYMDIKTDRVFADFMTNTSCDKTKHIVKRARLRQNPKYPDGPIYIYEAALCNFEGKFYVGFSEADIISVVTMPVWFGMSYSGNEVHFRLHDKFLGCNKQTGKIETKDSTFSFEEISPNNGTDVPDGNPREVDREVDMRENSSSVRDSENEIDTDNLATGATVNDFGNILDVTDEMPVDDKFKSESRIRELVHSCEASPVSSNTSMASCGSADSGYESSSRVKRRPWNRKAQPACKVKLQF